MPELYGIPTKRYLARNAKRVFYRTASADKNGKPQRLHDQGNFTCMFSCKDCPAQYTGQTCRQLKTEILELRMKEKYGQMDHEILKKN